MWPGLRRESYFFPTLDCRLKYVEKKRIYDWIEGSLREMCSRYIHSFRIVISILLEGRGVELS